MMDIVLNHTSGKHDWAKKARDGNKNYQDYFYFLITEQYRMNTIGRCPKYFLNQRPEILHMFLNATNGDDCIS